MFLRHSLRFVTDGDSVLIDAQCGCEDSSQESEIYAFSSLGIDPRDVLLFEDELCAMVFEGMTIPEIVTKHGVSVEVKRLPYTEHVTLRTRRGKPVWHWATMIYAGLKKLSYELRDMIIQKTSVHIRHHILVVIVPFTFTDKQIRRIEYNCSRVQKIVETCVPTSIKVIQGPLDLF